MIPRIQGNAIEVDGKWSFEIFFSVLGEERCDHYTFHARYDTKAEALDNLKKTTREIVEMLEVKIDGKVSGKYIDIQTNATRNWDEH